MLEKVPFILMTIYNPIRYSIIKILGHDKNIQCSNLMRDCDLDPLSQTGIFNYHINQMLRIGIFIKDMGGMYYLTDRGRRIFDFLIELEKSYPIAFQREVIGGEKMDKIKTGKPLSKGSGDDFMHLMMHHSGLSFIQSDLDPGDVISIAFLCYEDGKVADIVPIYRIKILPDACTTIEDGKELINQWHNKYPEDKGRPPHISVVIDIIK